MQASAALAELNAVNRSGRGDIEVRGVQYDSRRISAGDIFVAMRGGTTDGNQYIEAAIRKGAVAIVTDSPETFADLRERQLELSIVLVEHGRRALAEVSATVFGHPEHMLKISAVTGTNGKTTTAFLIEQLLTSAGRKCLLMGTIETKIDGESRPSEHTTPESRDVLAVMAEAVARGCTEAVMEFSSHALEQERVWGLPVDVAIFTNLTQDHLDYHATMDDYALAKARLFRGVGTVAPRVAIINRWDHYADLMIEAASGCGKVVTYQEGMPLQLVSREQWAADYRDYAAGRTEFLLKSTEGDLMVVSSLTGRVNLLNLLAAMATAKARGVTTEQIVMGISKLRPAPGRFEPVPNDKGITVVVDYAHTPDALENLIDIARNLIDFSSSSSAESRVITMFGCGGDRDRTKRPKMGSIAAAGSDLVIITSDNPRSEGPLAIIEEILPGVREGRSHLVTGPDQHESISEFVVEPDRRAAIQLAIAAARPGDIVLLAGKGHEKVQITAHGATPFDDVAEAALALQSLQEVTK